MVYDDGDAEDFDDNSEEGCSLENLRTILDLAERKRQGLPEPGWKIKGRTSGVPRVGYPVVTYQKRNVSNTMYFASRQDAIDAGAISGGDTDEGEDAEQDADREEEWDGEDVHAPSPAKGRRTKA